MKDEKKNSTDAVKEMIEGLLQNEMALQVPFIPLLSHSIWDTGLVGQALSRTATVVYRTQSMPT